jgi:hypothetical protein
MFSLSVTITTFTVCLFGNRAAMFNELQSATQRNESSALDSVSLV